MVKITCGEKCEDESDVTAEYHTLVRFTEKAVLVRFLDVQCWVPFSHIVEHDESEMTLRVTGWLAEQEGIEADE